MVDYTCIHEEQIQGPEMDPEEKSDPVKRRIQMPDLRKVWQERTGGHSASHRTPDATEHNRPDDQSVDL